MNKIVYTRTVSIYKLLLSKKNFKHLDTIYRDIFINGYKKDTDKIKSDKIKP